VKIDLSELSPEAAEEVEKTLTQRKATLKFPF
jgi:hypothetical protein